MRMIFANLPVKDLEASRAVPRRDGVGALAVRYPP